MNTKFAIIDYTNWRGERAERSIRPIRIEFRASEWHPEPQWLLVAYDERSDSERTFAMQHIHSFRHETEPTN